MTTLHPLHLWKWLELTRRIQGNTIKFSDTEREFMRTRMAQLPTLLNTFLLHPAMFTPNLFTALAHLEEPRLVLAGELRNPSVEDSIGVPYYQPTAQQNVTTFGLDKGTVQGLLERFLAFYPPARIGLALVVIDPPALKPILEACVALADCQLLYGARIQIYQTNSQAQAYEPQSLDDTGLLSRFRSDPRWSFTIDLEHTNYGQISKQMKDTGPWHIAILCDPSEAVVQPIIRTSQGQPHPFGVPIHLAYDAIRDTVRRIPAPTGGIFDAYTGVRNALSGELSRRTLGISNRPAITDQALQSLTNATYWLIVFDRPNGTLELPKIGKQLAWQSFGDRTLAVYTRDQEQERWDEHINGHLRTLNVRLDGVLVGGYLGEVLPIFPNGLLGTIDKPPQNEADAKHQALRQHSLQTLLGVVTTLHTYRQHEPRAMLISIDTKDICQAFGLAHDTPADVAHLLVVWHERAQIYFDVIAVQTIDTTISGLPALDKSTDVFAHLETFARTLEQLFVPGADTTLLDPMRRELLREYLSIAVFAPSANELSQEQRAQVIGVKAAWANVINELFNAYTPMIRLRSVRVALQGGRQTPPQWYRDEPYFAEIVNIPSTALQATAQTVSATQPVPIPLVDATQSEQAAAIAPDVAALETQPVTQAVLRTQLPSGTELPEQPVLGIKEDIAGQAKRLRQVLIDYGIAVAYIDEEKTQIGPRVIRYWVKLQPPGGRLAEVQKYAVDLARELGSKTVPLIDNILGERYIGIDLAREQPQIMPFAPALAQLAEHQPDKLSIAMGVNAAGQHVVEDLVKMPHMLVAGTTGSGKTMFLTNLIASLALRHLPADLQLLLIDPKQTDFVIFDRLSHLRDGHVFYDPAEAIDTLRMITGPELERRTELLTQARCPNNLEYNRRNPLQRMPWLVIVVDEFADIMLTLTRNEREAFERQVGRLAAIGRAKGIHLVLATQRPTTDVITGTLKANIPARVSFRLPSLTDSRTILDRGAAEHLLGQGDMLAFINGEIQRLQGYYASYEALDQLMSMIDGRGGSNGDTTITRN